MNPMFNLIKQRGWAVFIPLLLLTTACGEDAPSASQKSNSLPDLANLTMPAAEADSAASRVAVEEPVVKLSAAKKTASASNPTVVVEPEALIAKPPRTVAKNDENAAVPEAAAVSNLLTLSPSATEDVAELLSAKTDESQVTAVAQTQLMATADVPEPATIASIAVAALSLRMMRRNQSLN